MSMRTFKLLLLGIVVVAGTAVAVALDHQSGPATSVTDTHTNGVPEAPRTLITRCMGTPDEIVPVGDGQVFRYHSTKPEEMLRACALRIDSDEVLAFVNRNGGVEELVFTRRSVRRQP